MQSLLTNQAYDATRCCTQQRYVEELHSRVFFRVQAYLHDLDVDAQPVICEHTIAMSTANLLVAAAV